MSYLRSATIANESPQGRPRVFLACHPDDLGRCIDTVLHDLFSAVNCAVYYMDPEQEYDFEELRTDLSQMQLFVFAVTEKLLKEPSMAMDELFPYAEKEHIPVLPLIQEENVSPEDFGERFGDLQFLSRWAITATSISYEDQLNKYLSSVLINDELAQKVRDAFDAYIFLSYRKKDRAHAQELMRLIHKNDFCRDVAIWYDEFLVPGENFNDAIKDMLVKSDLFALAVTPNLVNEENYVMTTEYPDAVEQNKKIVAFEMVPTKRKDLEDNYEDIPKCTDPRDSESLAKALSDALGRISMREDRDSDSDHLYYIGLAYLGGIDVEVDHDRAFELISKSADTMNVEATKKLVSMYRNGDGVPRSYEKAIEIQRNYVSLLKTIFESNEGVRSSPMYASALYELSDLYDISKDPAKQKETLGELIGICDSYDQGWSALFRSIAVKALGELEAEQGNYKEAKELFLDSLERIRAQMDIGADFFASSYASGCMQLASLCRRYSDFDEAKSYCKEALETAEKYAGKSNFVGSNISAYNLLGEMAASEGDLKSAEEYYDKVGELYEGLQKAGKDVSSGLAGLERERTALKSERTLKEDLGEIYKDYGKNISSDYEQDKADFHKMQERIREKMEAKKQNVDYSGEIDRRMEVLEAVRDKASSSEIEDRRKVADAYVSAAMVQQTAGKYEDSEASNLAAYEFYDEYIKTKPDPEAKVMMVGILSGLSEASRNLGKKEESARYEEELIRLSKELVETRGTVRDYEVLAAGYSDWAGRLKEDGETDHAEAMYLKAIEAAEKMVQVDPGRHQREFLAGVYYRLAYLNVDPGALMFGMARPDIEPLAYAYEIYTQLGREYPDDSRIMNEMNRISGSFIMNGILLTEIDDIIENKKPLKQKGSWKPDSSPEDASGGAPAAVKAEDGPADKEEKKGGGLFGKLFGK